MTRTYAQCCPLTRALDVVGERWTLLIVRDLFDGPRRFSRLRADLPDLSPTLLTQRLRDLRSAGVIETGDDGYQLTERGRALWPAVAELARWGLDLVDRPRPGDHQPDHFDRIGTLFLVRPERLPDKAFAAELTLDAGTFTITIDGPDTPTRGRVGVIHGPHPRPDVRVTSSVGALTRFRQGRLGVDELVDRGHLSLTGTLSARRTFLAILAPGP